jgi:hypothetical protein
MPRISADPAWQRVGDGLVNFYVVAEGSALTLVECGTAGPLARTRDYARRHRPVGRGYTSGAGHARASGSLRTGRATTCNGWR